jgi:hypothetical protein
MSLSYLAQALQLLSLTFYVRLMLLLLISPAAAFAYAVAGLSRLLGCKQHAIARAGIEAGLVEDVFVGCGIPEGAAGAPLSKRSQERSWSAGGLLAAS